VSALQRLFRAPMAPVRRLLDGRFADVNRRLGDTRAAVEQQSGAINELKLELAAYGATQNEAISYTGVDLRRLAESLEAHELRMLDEVHQMQSEVERLDQRGYVERLDRTSQGPLSELDGALASAINRANGHQGFAAQAKLWFNPAMTIELGEGSAAISGVNERIVELPFALGRLGRLDPPARILDIGSAESTFALSAASLGYRVTAVDPQGIPYEHPNLDGFSCRLEDWDSDGEPFAAAFLISAIEHFGLGAYGERAADEQADSAALARIRELLADDGLLILTTPFGEASIDDFERVYDDAGLDELFAGWKILERHTIMRTDRRTWQPGTGGAKGTVLAVATPLPRP
jgi:2-polyprenyl-3-methyl-5-hydroxy-6-metoxy-1,4-benzoquinol methylase